MSAPDIVIAATERQGNIIPVEWRIGITKPKGVVRVEIPEDAPREYEAAIAELAAIKALVDTKQIGTSMRPHKVVVTQRSIKELMGRKADESALVPYGRHLYLYVDGAKLSVAKPNWPADLEIDPARISSAKAELTSWPGGYCNVLDAAVGVSRHAVERFIERRHVRNDYWHAFQSILKALASPYLRIVPELEIAKTNPKLRRNAFTKVLHQTNTDTAFIVVNEEEGWVLVTIHPYHQEFVPTLVGGRVEYRRNG